ncbi:MAG: glycosyltransferase family 2 protein [Candidatus Daviesbacteria bacterium]|nr:glycosyltransferase family 2 protein [Candidatus Daviesbacteria bacterium]
MNSNFYKDFSVIIPTYNRSNFLKKAITSVLRQKNVTFEIIIGDNASKDNTADIVKNFSDSRIKYFKNYKNLGHQKNFKKCFEKASGEYIFALGDDDFILEDHALFKILKVMRKNKVGVGEIGAIYYSESIQNPCRLFTLGDRLILIKSRKDKKLPLKAMDINVSFFSGLIFDNSVVNSNRITNSYNYPYFPLVYDAIRKKGAIFIPNLHLVAHISLRFVPEYFSLDKLGSFYMEDYLDMVRKYLNVEDYQKHKKEFLRESTILLPSIKLFTDNMNYLKILRRMILLDSLLIIFPRFIILALIGFLPKFILKSLRELMIYQGEKRIRKIVKKYDYYQKIKRFVNLT